MLKEIARFIEDLSVGPPWVRDTDMFVGYLPGEDIEDSDIPVRCMVVLENTPAVVVPELPDRVDKMIQIWNRSDDYFETRDDAVEMYTSLHGVVDGSELPEVDEAGYFAMTIEGVAYPAPIENPDEKGRFVFSTNYLWRIKKPYDYVRGRFGFVLRPC